MNQAELETPSCPLCQASPGLVGYQWAEHPCEVRQCSACGFWFLSPRPCESAMIDLYRQNTYFGADGGEGYASYAAQERPLRATFARLLQTLRRRGLTGGRLLEVGCGYGYLLDEARGMFDLRHGCDFSAEAATKARVYAEATFVGGAAAAPPGQYTCVIANHVIEHVYQPESFLKELVSRVSPGGHVVISTPHMGSLWRLLMGHRWPSFKIPEHVLYFDEPHLRSLFQRCGLTQITRVPYPHAFPIDLVGAKLGLKLPQGLGSLWIPGTTLALSGKVL